MSSESESEEFFDAFDVTPSKIISEEITPPKVENKTPSPVTLLPKNDLASIRVKPTSKIFESTNKQTCHKSAWRSRTTSPVSDLTSSYSLSSKLASSLPTLHIQGSGVENDPSQPCAQSLLLSLEKPFAKEEDAAAATLMPPPKELPINLEVNLASNKYDLDESSSACSGSLLDTLGAVEDDDSRRNPRWRGRRARRRKSKTRREEDDDGCPQPPSSPGDSQSSSMDAFFPSSHTAPFRVVEVDATSVYSTTFSQDKGSKSPAKIEEKQEVITNADKRVSDKPANIKDEFASDSKNEDTENVVPLSPEPDVVASTKSNSLPRSDISPTIQTLVPPVSKAEENIPSSTPSKSPHIFVEPPPAPLLPVAPPRRNKKRRKKDDDTISVSSVTSLPTPAFSLALKDADVISQHLDLVAASKGDYIVSPLDSERSRGPRGPTDSELARIESAGDTTSQASTPETARASSHRVSPSETLGDSPKSSVSTHPLVSSQSSFLKETIGGSSISREDVVRAQVMAGLKPDIAGLTDEEILSQVSVLNLDTGERIPLSEAEECLPAALNPLSLHIMRLTSEYVSSKTDQDDEESDEESTADVSVRRLPEIDSYVVKKKTSQFKKFLGKKMESAVNKAKTLAQEVSQKNKEEKDVFEDDAPAQNTMQYVKIKTSHSYKGPHEFDNLMYVQELKGEHTGPVWCMKFSPCGRLLATAGQDHILRVWVLKQAFNYFLDIRTKWNADVKSSPTPSQESLVSQHSSHSSEDIGTLDPSDDGVAPFMPKPFCVYSGHTADVLDLSWSKNYFMLTSSMDKTVRLWHINRKECLCIFKHVDFVTAIAFHPKDDRYFISGSLDGKLRLWSIPDKQVVMWNEVEGHPKLITAANFCQNGTYTVVGTYNGRCIFYKTDELKYFTQIHVKSSRGKNARGRKITGIEPLPEKDMLLITSNDSRIRLYDLNVLNVACKYKGYSNISSQIRAGFSHDGKYIVAGSENQCIYIWKTHHDYSKFSSARKDRNLYWEGVRAHSAVVTCAIFSPRPDHVFNFIELQGAQNKRKEEKTQDGEPFGASATSNGATTTESSTSNKGYVLVSADFEGCIKVFLKKEKPKHSSLPASALA